MPRLPLLLSLLALPISGCQSFREAPRQTPEPDVEALLRAASAPSLPGAAYGPKLRPERERPAPRSEELRIWSARSP